MEVTAHLPVCLLEVLAHPQIPRDLSTGGEMVRNQRKEAEREEEGTGDWRYTHSVVYNNHELDTYTTGWI